MSNEVKPASTYGRSARAAASGSRVRPSRSMSAICQRPVSTREIDRSGASVTRSTRAAIALSRWKRREARIEVDALAAQLPRLAEVDDGAGRHHQQPERRRAEVPGG